MPTRIALCTEYPIAGFGGTEVLVRTLAGRLQTDCEVILVSCDKTADLEKSGLTTGLAAHLPWPGGEPAGEATRRLTSDLRASRVDLAHFHIGGNYGWGNRRPGLCPILPLARLGVPCVTTAHGVFELLDGYCDPARSPLAKALLLPLAWASKSHMLAHIRWEAAVSRHDLRNLRGWYPQARGKFTQLYHSQIDESWTAGGSGERAKQILCVGTIGPRKGQHFLARAFAKIAREFPEWSLLLAGRSSDVAMEEEIGTLARTLPAGAIRRVTGATDGEVREMMATASLFAMPSLREGLGLSLQEALYLGCAAIGSRVGGIPELIDDGQNGLLVSPGDAGALADALAALMGDAMKRKKLSTRATASVVGKGMTAPAMADRYRALYKEALDG